MLIAGDVSEFALYYKGGKQTESKITGILNSMGIEFHHRTRDEMLSGETDPHFRKHVKANFTFVCTEEQLNEMETRLRESKINYSFFM